MCEEKFQIHIKTITLMPLYSDRWRGFITCIHKEDVDVFTPLIDLQIIFNIPVLFLGSATNFLISLPT
jgi:hypothetical protein